MFDGKHQPGATPENAPYCEPLLLSIAGGTVGVLLPSWLIAPVKMWWPPIDILTVTGVEIDIRVCSFRGPFRS